VAPLLLAVDPTSLISFDQAGAKARPVSKVITLLKDMLKQMEKEADEDEAVYDKMACWCETNDKEKTKAVKDAQSRISDLTTSIEEFSAQSARLNTEVKNLKKEVASNQKGLDAATSIRQKQLAEFNGEEKDLLQSISALKSAVVVLSKHHSMLQIPMTHLLGVAATLQYQLSKHHSLLQGVLTPTARRMIGGFVQAPGSAQSGEIFGILKQMKETFETNLAASQKEETASQKSYEDLKKAKETQIEAGQDQIDTKAQEFATADSKNAQAKEDVQDTKTSLSADTKFLAMLKNKCAMNDKEWDQRQKTRQEEMQAVSKAQAVLSSDDAHDLFTKTFNPSFIQTESSDVSQRRQQASSLLKLVAAKLDSPRLATLAMKLQLDAFTRVKKSIDTMVVQLVKEKRDEIRHKDFCVKEFSSNDQETEKKTREKADVKGKISDLELSVKQYTQAIEAIKAENAEDSKQLKRAKADRNSANKEFQMTIADQRATQRLLVQASNVLKSFYAKKAALLQTKAAPGGFSAYKNNGGAGGVMGLLQQIVSDAKAMEAEATRDEANAKKAYDAFVKETNASLQAKNKNIVRKSSVKAKTEAGLVEARGDKRTVLLELEQLGNSKAELHQSCDFLTKNFSIRQVARDEEVEALNQAKAILSGANFK